MTPATKNLPTKEERVEVKQSVCMLSNQALQDKVDILIDKAAAGTATEKELREAAIMAEVIINRGNSGR